MSSQAPLHPSRRTLARGAAWSVPVVALAATAPAARASEINCACFHSAIDDAGGNIWDRGPNDPTSGSTFNWHAGVRNTCHYSWTIIGFASIVITFTDGSTSSMTNVSISGSGPGPGTGTFQISGQLPPTQKSVETMCVTPIFQLLDGGEVLGTCSTSHLCWRPDPLGAPKGTGDVVPIG